jgi:hypothetical protein
VCFFVLFCSVFVFFLVPGREPRALYLLGKHSTPELYSYHFILFCMFYLNGKKSVEGLHF